MHVCVAALFFSTRSVNGGKNTSQRSAINNVISHPLWETTSTEGGRVTACSTRRLLRGRKCSAEEGGGGAGSATRKRPPHSVCPVHTTAETTSATCTLGSARSATAPPPEKMKGPVFWMKAWRLGGLEAWRRAVHRVRPQHSVTSRLTHPLNRADEVWPVLAAQWDPGVLACSAGHNRG